MPERIPVEVAEKLAQDLGLRQVILCAWDGDRTHVVTFGGSASDSDQAAQGGNFVKKALGWPDYLLSESPKVAALEREVERLRREVGRLNQKAEPKPSGGAVFSHRDCVFNYCPYPDGGECRLRGSCAHRV